MAVQSMGYIGLGVKDVAAWRAFANDVLGCHVDDGPDGGLLLRVDSRAWRIAVEPTGEDDIIYAGWEVSGPAALAALIAKLQAAGVAVTTEDALAKKRGVRGLATCTDPAGMVCELFWGATERFERPFVSPMGVQGFLTGDQGLGHIVIGADDLGAVHHFYENLLGFKLSDYIDMTVAPEVTIPVTFMHCNARHHSYAFAPKAPGNPTKLIHFMLQTNQLDDVGFALDRLEAAGHKISWSLGRHSNDHMLSFYAWTPSGFEVEYGWGAREIDDATWLTVRHDRTSSWGHKTINAQP
jgi:biphenyl-2,3-diol 1,2-dioxygenase